METNNFVKNKKYFAVERCDANLNNFLLSKYSWNIFASENKCSLYDNVILELTKELIYPICWAIRKRNILTL